MSALLPCLLRLTSGWKRAHRPAVPGSDVNFPLVSDAKAACSQVPDTLLLSMPIAGPGNGLLCLRPSVILSATRERGGGGGEGGGGRREEEAPCVE